jgi:hypothetical protein
MSSKAGSAPFFLHPPKCEMIAVFFLLEEKKYLSLSLWTFFRRTHPEMFSSNENKHTWQQVEKI